MKLVKNKDSPIVLIVSFILLLTDTFNVMNFHGLVNTRRCDWEPSNEIAFRAGTQVSSSTSVKIPFYLAYEGN